MPADPKVPANLLKSPMLRWADDGTVRFRRRAYSFFVALGVGILCFAWLWFSRRNDMWLGPPMIIGGCVGVLLWMVVQGRRHLRVARSPGGQFRLPLADLFLLTAAVAAVAAGYSINDHQRSAELARRQQLKSDASELLGPGGSLDRDHRGCLRLTVADPAFDDTRLKQVAELLRDDDRRYGVTRFALKVTSGMTPARVIDGDAWSGLTDRSVATLLAWESLAELEVFGSRVSAAGAEQLTGLPDLRWLRMTTGFDRETTARFKRTRPDLWIGPTSDLP